MFKEKRNYINITGGLGNQLYMLAYANYLRENGYKNITLFTTIKEKGDTKDPNKRNINLIFAEEIGLKVCYIPSLVFIIIKKLLGNSFLSSFIKFYIEPKKEWAVFHKLPENLGKYNFHIGYYQSYLYQSSSFIDKIKKNVQIRNSIIRENDVALHIRRGDFLKGNNISIFEYISTDYYLKALERISKKINIKKIYIFTDDMKSIQQDIEEISKKYTIEVVKGNSVLEDLQLLTCFKNYILGNSTFAWWGAKLSKYENPIVIVPKEPWKIKMENKTPYLENWLSI